MTDRERAKELADEIERHNYGCFREREGFDLPVKLGEDVISFLRAYAASPAPSGPKTIFDNRSRWDDVAWANGPMVFAALRDLLDAVNERRFLRDSIESTTISRAENAVAQVLSQTPRPAVSAAGYVTLPREVHEQMKDALRDILKRNEIQHWFCTEKQRAALAAAEKDT